MYYLLLAFSTTVAADYTLYSQFNTLDCSGPAFVSQATNLQPCLLTGGSPPAPASYSFTFINSTAYLTTFFSSINCTGAPLSSTPSCV